MRDTAPCTIAILRPPETSWSAFLEHAQAQAEDREDDSYDPYIDDWCEEFRTRIEELSDELRIRSRVVEHQLFDGKALRFGRDSAQVASADVIATIDPTDGITTTTEKILSQNPRARALLAYSTSEALDTALSILRRGFITILERKTREVHQGSLIVPKIEMTVRSIPRKFAFTYRDETQRDYCITQALRYPECDTHRTH